jgi:uncharacterized membrane protein
MLGMGDAMNQRSFTSALLLGVTAGLRTMTAPASLALAQQQPGAERIWLLGSPRAARILTTLALGELVFDKLPFAPSRIAPAGLSGRLLSGAMCGAAVVREDQVAGALLGIAGALTSSFAGYALRKRAWQASGIPDALIGLAEDGLAIGIGMVAATMADRGGKRGMFEVPSAHVA